MGVELFKLMTVQDIRCKCVPNPRRVPMRQDPEKAHGLPSPPVPGPVPPIPAPNCEALNIVHVIAQGICPTTYICLSSGFARSSSMEGKLPDCTRFI